MKPDSKGKMKNITWITIIAVIAIAAVFLGVNHLMDAYAKRQGAGQQSANAAVQPGNQAAVGKPAGHAHSLTQIHRVIREIMESPEEIGVCGKNLKWYYKDEILVISGTGEMDGYSYSEDTPWHVRGIDDLIDCVIVDKGVTRIGRHAFSCCDSLREVILPDSVTGIDSEAFFYCEDLRKITLPDSVTMIKSYAFEGCSSLKELTIPASVTEIGKTDVYEEYDYDIVFLGCSDMTIYYSGNALESYINDHSSDWSGRNIVWVRQ